MTPDSQRYLLIGAGLFVLGAIGFLTRRNLILMVLSTELMLHGVSLTMVTFGKIHQTQEGQVFTIFTLTVASCEAGLALALVLSLFRKAHSLDVWLWSELRESDMPAPVSSTPIATETSAGGYDDIPLLTPAGLVPSDPSPESSTSVGAGSGRS
jgi:NADH-quinone oxidoreductase subunit K